MEYMTLGKGNKSKKFWATTNKDGIIVSTGKEGQTTFNISNDDIEKLLQFFKDKNWFLLGNSIDDAKVGGMGEYFKNILKASTKFASHISAVLVHHRKLEYRYKGNAIELKVL